MVTVLRLFWILFAIVYASDCDNNTTADIITAIFSNTNIYTLYPSWWNSSCDICLWNPNHLKCSYDTQNNPILIAIQMSCLSITGTINSYQYPSSIQYINLNNNSLAGSISWSNLPSSIEYLNLGNNNFDGIIDFNALNNYSSLTTLYLSNNNFQSTLSWNEYTINSLQYLFLTNNLLYNSLNFNTMPESLVYCLLGYNQFNGSLDFGQGYIDPNDNLTALQNIEYLDISNNYLQGNVINIENIPDHIQYLRINNNQLSDDINHILAPLSSSDIIDLSISNNQIYGTINYDIFLNDSSSFESLQSLFIQHNNLKYVSSDIIDRKIAYIQKQYILYILIQRKH